MFVALQSEGAGDRKINPWEAGMSLSTDVWAEEANELGQSRWFTFHRSCVMSTKHMTVIGLTIRSQMLCSAMHHLVPDTFVLTHKMVEGAPCICDITQTTIATWFKCVHNTIIHTSQWQKHITECRHYPPKNNNKKHFVVNAPVMGLLGVGDTLLHLLVYFLFKVTCDCINHNSYGELP